MFQSEFGRLITAMVTPFKEDLSIDETALEKLLNHLVANGSDSILITGTTGENPTLTHQEEWELLCKTKEIINGRVPILFGAGSNCTQTAVQASLKAQDYGADAILSVAPYYNKPTQAGIFVHFAEVAKAIKLPIMLYNNPGRTCSSIELETVKALRQEFSNIQALKESSGSLDFITQLKININGLDIYAGDDNLILPSLAVGAVGAVSVSSHLVGLQIHNLIDQFLKGQNQSAQIIHSRLFPLFKGVFASASPGPIKQGLYNLNLCQPFVRLPLTQPSSEVCNSLKQIMQSLELI